MQSSRRSFHRNNRNRSCANENGTSHFWRYSIHLVISIFSCCKSLPKYEVAHVTDYCHCWYFLSKLILFTCLVFADCRWWWWWWWFQEKRLASLTRIVLKVILALICMYSCQETKNLTQYWKFLKTIKFKVLRILQGLLTSSITVFIFTALPLWKFQKRHCSRQEISENWANYPENFLN